MSLCHYIVMQVATYQERLKFAEQEASEALRSAAEKSARAREVRSPSCCKHTACLHPPAACKHFLLLHACILLLQAYCMPARHPTPTLPLSNQPQHPSSPAMLTIVHTPHNFVLCIRESTPPFPPSSTPHSTHFPFLPPPPSTPHSPHPTHMRQYHPGGGSAQAAAGRCAPQGGYATAAAGRT
jgi:hypothetical protein